MASTILSDNGASSGSAGLKTTADSTGALALQTTTVGGTATTAVTIDTSQNVGIGTSSPSKKFVVSDAAASGFEVSPNDAGGGYNRLLNYNRSTSQYMPVRYEGSTHTWYASTAGTTRAMDIDTSGNVGIGTTVTNGRLNVYGPSVYQAIYNTNATSNDSHSATIQAYGTYWNKLVLDGSQLIFNAYGAERARIDSSGNLLVAQTASGSWASGGVVLFNNYGGYQAIGVGHASGVASGSAFQNFGYNAAIIGSITQNGTTGVLYNLTSDYRLKNDPQPLTGAKEFVMALQPKKWQWWDGSGEGVGFIAHEFMEVAKYSGNGEKDAVDENGNPVYQSIQPSSSEVMANLVSLIQEQQALITSLTERITALENK